MTVGDLKRLLNDYDENKVVYIADPNSRYSYSIDEWFVDHKGLASFYGKDKANVLFILEGNQVGRMCDLSNLDIDE